MRPGLLIGFASALLLATPSALVAQRGGAGGGFVASGAHYAPVASGAATHAANAVRPASANPSGTAPLTGYAARTHAGMHSGDAPARHAALNSSWHAQNPPVRVYPPIGIPVGPRRNPPSATIPSQAIFVLGVPSYYYAAPGDEAAAAPQQDTAQDVAEVEGQPADDQQAAVTAGRNDERIVERNVDPNVEHNVQRGAERADNRDDGGAEADSAARATDRQEAEALEPLPDVGSLVLVLRDGTRLDVVAFTMTQGQVVYITPEGRRLSVSAELFDADATQRLNQERGTPMQLPL
jgi:hypothetical protein